MHYSFKSCNLTSNGTELARLFQLSTLLLNSQVEAFLTQHTPPGRYLACAKVSDLFNFHILSSAVARQKLGPDWKFIGG